MCRTPEPKKVAGSNPVGDTRSDFRRTHDLAYLAVSASAALKPFQKLNWPDGMAVSEPAWQLKAENLSVRLQSWVWLAERGIIAPPDVALECWPKRTNDSLAACGQSSSGGAGS